jgi:hypothetical protein
MCSVLAAAKAAVAAAVHVRAVVVTLQRRRVLLRWCKQSFGKSLFSMRTVVLAATALVFVDAVQQLL